MEKGDLPVLRVTIGVSFAFPPLLNKSNRGSFLVLLFYVLLFLFNLVSFVLVFFYFLSNVL